MIVLQMGKLVTTAERMDFSASTGVVILPDNPATFDLANYACKTFNCDKQYEQLPAELWQSVTPQSPDKNWGWASGELKQEKIAHDDPNCYTGGPFCRLRRIVVTDFDVNELNKRPLNWAPTGQ